MENESLRVLKKRSLKKTHSRKLVASVTDKHTCLPDSSISNSNTFYELGSAHYLSPRTKFKTQKFKELKKKKKMSGEED